MRIIAGKHKGRIITSPQFEPTRPTTDFAKEGLFNTINNYFNFENVSFLDLFSGTGALSYEFSSRGCKDITSVEQYAKCAAFIRRTMSLLKAEGHILIQDDVFRFLEHAHRTYDIIFAGPPYPLPNLATLPDIIVEKNILEGEGWFVLEHNPKHNFEKHPHFWKSKNYGTTIFSIFRNKQSVMEE